ncbi:monosaccharide ABC transporter substrate-binding protein, CUT2 family [Saccharopolyspora kobensis]|uniref:Monosaccharide ABC transporter substrate-binding protein, CUT2 family n=1 Tax=Saccharopolyspora kobensis TaxID=146035 RepID=A0A1H6DR11_9PSEU|nr:substrate-binding domain-containing protein [Saccharopolyspora kobensis]SEG87701.1 monosaccharide ABC transporter substrate-binding protein, CUT2 family [Saccharopolyspora kobensis]SFE05485.1 monosaccharide ABC transporter substrate-binding protein, CUT2 family [Saccharopolyspora kobensis]
MKKVLSAACVLVSVAAAGCSVGVREQTGGGGEQGGPIKIAVVPKAIGFDFWEKVRVGAECAGGKQPDVTVHWDGVHAESDVSGQQSLLQDLLAQGDVRGLVYAATDAKALADVTKSAQGQGTTVVNMDSGTSPQPPDVPVYATNNVAAAEQATDLLAEQLGGRGKVAFIEFQAGTSTNETRGEGFKRGMAKHPGLQLVAQQSSDSDFNRALQVTQDILTANPDLNGIYAANEPSVLGAAEAVRQAGKTGQVKIIGWDTSEGEIKALRDGVITGLIAQNPFKMGYAAVNAAVAEIRGEPNPAPDTDTGSTLITKENVDSPEVQKLLNPSCDNPPA